MYNMGLTHVNTLPLLSLPEPLLLSGTGSMSSKPQDTMCLPPSKQDGDPGPPSNTNNLEEQGEKKNNRRNHHETTTVDASLVSLLHGAYFYP